MTVQISRKSKKQAAVSPSLYVILFSGAFLLRALLAARSMGFDSDTVCFAAWANRIYELGPKGFYSPEVFTDYPPGYMYLLYLIGAVYAKSGISFLGAGHLLLLRLPSILSDLGCGALLGLAARKRLSSRTGFFLCLAYLFQPAVILNSSVWGQVDSVFTLTLLVACLALYGGRLSVAYLAFGAGLLIKPQALFIAPVLLTGFLKQVILRDFSVRRLLVNLGEILATLAGMVLLCVPFGLANVWKQYFSTIGSYPYASVNAYNFWALLGKSWVHQDELLLGLPIRLWGTLLLSCVIAATLIIGLAKRTATVNYAFLSAFLLVGIFVFSVRMHERYLYPAMLFFLLAYVFTPAKQLLLCYGGFSLLHFINTAHVLFCYDPADYSRTAPVILLTGAGMVLMALFLYRSTAALLSAEGTVWAASVNSSAPTASADDAAQTVSANSTAPTASEDGGAAPSPSKAPLRLKRRDAFCMLAVTVLYSCIALFDLGDSAAPVSSCELTCGQTIELDFGGRLPVSLHYYIAPWHSRAFLLEEQHPEAAFWTECGQLTLENVFTWQELSLPSDSSRLRLTLLDESASLLELVFLDSDGNILEPVNADAYPALFDESELFPARSSFRNSMYFDEIYHARTAYEFLQGLPAYENTHPPLGKLFIALGILIFGMNPFGWRIVGTLFGIAMVPAAYLFARKLTESTAASALACVLFAFDFMHFTQTRIATIDVYVTFFVLLMYFFMYCYASLSFYDTPLRRTLLPLGLCGLCMGLGVACKWTGVYAGLGLAVIFFAVLLRRYREYRYAASRPDGETAGISHRHILEVFRPHALKTVVFCLIAFVAVPALIYLLSYLPFLDYSEDGLLLRLLHNQETMLQYHSQLTATHPYSSRWYEWPILKRPVWYYSSIVTGSAGNGGLREGISAFGNPLVWWTGIPSAFYMLRLWAKKKDKTAAFLLVGYLAQYLPWFFVTRVTFLYHYFPSVIFVVLMSVYSLLQWRRRLKKHSFLLLCTLYGGTAMLLFLLFYPVLSGQPVDAGFVAKWLRWFDSWVLVAG